MLTALLEAKLFVEKSKSSQAADDASDTNQLT
jgi:hypothetical protein